MCKRSPCLKTDYFKDIGKKNQHYLLTTLLIVLVNGMKYELMRSRFEELFDND